MKQRVISAIIALMIVIPVLILGEKYFALGCALLSVQAIREFLLLKENTNKIPILVQLLVVISTVLLVLSDFDGYSIAFGLSYKGIALAALGLFLPTIFYKQDTYKTGEAFYLLGCVVLTGLVFNSFILVRNLGLNIFIYLLLITTMTDTFAYVFGSLIGKHKLCPLISPKKSWEGSICGSLMGTFIASVFYHATISPISIKIILISLILTVLGQLGDLFFSKIKRENGIKDFSNIMPGHGGILDRLDSLIIVVLAYIVMFSLI